MKGIILAGGSGTRLHPVTLGVSKQLLPVFDKPMIYYALSVLMLARIRDILVITTPQDMGAFRTLLGDGSELGIIFSYKEQAKPGGLPEAFIIGAEHIGDDSVALILGDNIFYGPGFTSLLTEAATDVEGCVVFGYRVDDPHRHGIGEADASGRLISVEEKPSAPRSDRAIPGLYFFDNDVVEIARGLIPSTRGELEITDVIREYMRRDSAKLVDLGRGFAWLDAGTHDSLIEAAQFVKALQHKQGLRIGCPEEIALRMGYISGKQCEELADSYGDSDYAEYVRSVAHRASVGDLGNSYGVS